MVQRKSALRYLKELNADGVLCEARAGKEMLFIHLKLGSDSHAFVPYA